MYFSVLLRLSLLVLPLPGLAALPPDYLAKCWQHQGAGIGPGYAAFSYRETTRELEHSQYPWQATTYDKKGTAWLSGQRFLRQDTLTQGAKTYYSQTQLGPGEVLFQDYGEKAVAAATPERLAAQLVGSARYSPVLLLGYLREHHVRPAATAPAGLVAYGAELPNARVTVLIRKADQLVERVTVLSHDELFGDVQTTFTYQDYVRQGPLRFARTVAVAKINGRVLDTVTVGAVAAVATAPALLARPAGYQLAAAKPEVPASSVEHFRPNLHLLNLPHTDDRVLVVEFRDFLVVAEAPLSSENGEYIIREARKIAPNKPIKYFVFGHYHPHYLGGLRAFVAAGATILGGPGTADYVRYLAQAPHTLQPDSLQRHPRSLAFEEVAQIKTITDGTFTMQIHCIGAQSAHTNDYLIYYFPTEKLLFEDDLVWIKREGGPRKASARQAGLTQAVQALKLPIDTVVQSWPVADYGVKTIIPYAELEQALQVK
ncbi:MBL fold metallo-hydrolase [Hymenobacter chitinivorans]|uniref:Glyoxylase-like metal-dependent hydrolase (Beta-lactamase superfamily II) n=1 Tax=Hymenobacter chitinivorans DSM 11115 TaxID=1121954 RepID=A0A2M9BR71_9BACT|nr:hypothetical protein [Hymenobacter chitinivorans]PJJ60454.1 glyoxylase-like metal-dependent hydrolase (beta-lactamase superfamily II) [Hymenobacter chitinivorans DSM 11115]